MIFEIQKMIFYSRKDLKKYSDIVTRDFIKSWIFWISSSCTMSKKCFCMTNFHADSKELLVHSNSKTSTQVKLFRILYFQLIDVQNVVLIETSEDFSKSLQSETVISRLIKLPQVWEQPAVDCFNGDKGWLQGDSTIAARVTRGPCAAYVSLQPRRYWSN